eukprot:gene7924-3012_t
MKWSIVREPVIFPCAARRKEWNDVPDITSPFDAWSPRRSMYSYFTRNDDPINDRESGSEKAKWNDEEEDLPAFDQGLYTRFDRFYFPLSVRRKFVKLIIIVPNPMATEIYKPSCANIGDPSNGAVLASWEDGSGVFGTHRDARGGGRGGICEPMCEAREPLDGAYVDAGAHAVSSGARVGAGAYTGLSGTRHGEDAACVRNSMDPSSLSTPTVLCHDLSDPVNDISHPESLLYKFNRYSNIPDDLENIEEFAAVSDAVPEQMSNSTMDGYDTECSSDALGLEQYCPDASHIVPTDAPVRHCGFDSLDVTADDVIGNGSGMTFGDLLDDMETMETNVNQNSLQLMVRGMTGNLYVTDGHRFDGDGPMQQIAEYISELEGCTVERLSFCGSDVQLQRSIRYYRARGLKHGSNLYVLPRRRGGAAGAAPTEPVAWPSAPAPSVACN